MHSNIALFSADGKRVSEAQMVYNYRNLLLSETNVTETTRRYHLRGAKKMYRFGIK